MPEVLESPLRTFIDPNKAREAGLRSAELRQQQARENEVLRQLLADKPIPEPPKPVNEEVNRQIDLANSLLAHAHEEIDRMADDSYGFCEHCKRHGANAKDHAALLREIRGLMEHLCRLHNIPQAPTTKHTPAKSRSTPQAVAYSLPVAQPTDAKP